MKICLVSKEVAGIRGGGIGSYVVEAGRALRDHGHEVWLLTAPIEAAHQDRIRRLPFDRVVEIGSRPGAGDAPRPFHAIPHYAYAREVHETLQSLCPRFDSIEFADYEAEGYVALREQRLFGSYGDTQLVVMLHSPTWECFQWSKQEHRAGLAIRELCALEDHAIRSAPVLRAPSRNYSNEVARRLRLEQPIRVVRCPMHMPARPPQPTAPRGALEDLRFVYTGRIEPRKGVEELLLAFRELPELSLRLIGGDVPYSPFGTSFREWLRERAPANVHFQDALPRDQLQARLGEVDVCILPSLLENYPYTCTEAMAAGRVVLGSRHGGMAEMIEHGRSGFLVDGRSPGDIVRVIREDLRAALPRLDSIGAAAAERARQLSDPQSYVEAVTASINESRTTARARSRPAGSESRVSIVVPFHRDKGTIDAAIDSALAQDHENLEVLIVDDGCPLETGPEILRRQARKDPRIRVVHQENAGLGAARNRGIAEATGGYVLLLDADNQLSPDYARLAVTALESHPGACFVVPDVRFFDAESGDTLGIYNPIPYDRRTALLLNRFGDAGACFRRSVFVDLGLRYDELRTGYEDWALWMDLDRRGLRGEHIPRVLYSYRVCADSMVVRLGRGRHATNMGILIDRHFGGLDPEAREILITLFQTAGHAVLDVMMGNTPNGPR